MISAIATLNTLIPNERQNCASLMIFSYAANVNSSGHNPTLLDATACELLKDSEITNDKLSYSKFFFHGYPS